MASLLALSHELLHCIFAEVHPADLASLGATCQTLSAYIRGNRLLHKDLYIRRWDEPKISAEPAWETEVQRMTMLEKVLESDSRNVKIEHLGFAASQINTLLETARTDPQESLNLEMLSDHFESQLNKDVFLCSSGLFETGGTNMQEAASTTELRHASAKLHCLYGRPVDPVPSKRCSPSLAMTLLFANRSMELTTSPSSNTRQQTRGFPVHTVARSKVYDLREYTEETLWGPFMEDGSQRVDWEKVEAIMIVLGFNLAKFTERSDGRFPLVWETPFVGATANSWVSPPPMAAPTKEMDEELSMIRELLPSIDEQDPYGVTGTWMRVVCFLDYNDLYAFNFSSQVPGDEPRPPIDTEEAIRLIRIKLQVTHVEPDEDDPSRLPVVHFRGNSRSLHASWDPNANSRIRGSVRQTPEGEIRWTTFSIFHGEERWRSEGIQVGGLRSARGILGNWFDKDYDDHGPAGPTAFWKLTDELADERLSSMPIHYF